MLLVLVIFGVGLIRSFFTPERTRTILAGPTEVLGDVLAALLGVVTPFCSCSALPLFIGFVEAGIPIGVTFAFLISAPMVNEIALVLLFGPLRLAHCPDLYVHGVAHCHGHRLGYRPAQHGAQVEDWSMRFRMGQTPALLQKLTWMNRIDYGLHQVKEIVGKVWLYNTPGNRRRGGHPRLRPRRLFGRPSWANRPGGRFRCGYSRAPLYSNAAGIIPVVQARLKKGRGPGTCAGFHDVHHRHLLSGNRHSPESVETQADRRIRRGCHGRDYHRWFYL